MKKDEFPVDSVFACGKINLKVTKNSGYSCAGCYFHELCGAGEFMEYVNSFTGPCSAEDRTDDSYILFVPV